MFFRISFTSLILMFSLTAIAQDPQFSQYYAAPLYLNPGFTGSIEQQRVAVNHRIQWPSLVKGFSTFAASYEFYDNKIKSGFGFLATTDAMGSGGWRTTYLGVNYSFKAQINRNWVFSPGLNFSYGYNGLNKNELVLRDGIINGDGVSYDPELTRLENKHFFDFSAGFVVYNKNIWLGFSAFHMNRPNISVIGDESELPMKLSVHGGAKVLLYNGPKKLKNVHYLTPSFIYRTQGNYNHELDIGLRYHIDPVAVGLWYRGIPIAQNTDNINDGIRIARRDALAFVATLLFDDFQIGYSYDFSISAKQTATGGAHEVSIGYKFKTKRRKKIRMKDMILPCPTFLK